MTKKQVDRAFYLAAKKYTYATTVLFFIKMPKIKGFSTDKCTFYGRHGLFQKGLDQKRRELRFLISGLVLAFFLLSVIFNNYRKRLQLKIRLLNQKDEIRSQKLSSILKDQEIQSIHEMIAVQERERERIASDLHDRIGSVLATIKLYVGKDAKGGSLDSSYNEKVVDLLDFAAKEVRRLSHEMASGTLARFGLIPALKELIDSINEASSLKIELILPKLEERLPSHREVDIYRIVQEIMSNVIKHAHASEVVIQFNRHNGTLGLMVEDDGIGFSKELAREGSGMGLRNIETRVKKLGGTLMIDSLKGRGSTIIIEIPIP